MAYIHTLKRIKMANIFIVGDGAIGLLYSYYLAQQHSVTLISKQTQCKPRFYQQHHTKQAINCQVINLVQLTASTQIDTVIFAVKAHQVASAFSQLKPFLSTQCQVILSHNGMGNVDELNAELTQKQGLYFLTTRLAGYKNTPFSVLHTGMGDSVLGDCNSSAKVKLPDVKHLLANIPALTTTNNIQQLRFEKLLVNIAINPLSALNNVKNGELRAPKFSRQIMNLLAEACNIAKALGINVDLAQALNSAYQVMAHTQANYSSMHQDFHHQRETEVMAICGYICQQGQKLNIDTPYNGALLTAIFDTKKRD